MTKPSDPLNGREPQTFAEYSTAYEHVKGLIRDELKWDEHKTQLWFLTSNPMLGDVMPMWMLPMGRYQKLLKVVTTMLEENTSDKAQ